MSASVQRTGYPLLTDGRLPDACPVAARAPRLGPGERCGEASGRPRPQAVTWQGCGPRECDSNPFFAGEVEPCIKGHLKGGSFSSSQ